MAPTSPSSSALYAAFVSLITLATAASASAQSPAANPNGRREIVPGPSEDISCAFRHPVQDIASFDQMPASITVIVRAHLGELAKRDTYFHYTDVLSPGDDEFPFHRFIRGGRNGEWWFLAFESGGVAYEKTVVFFTLSAKGAPKVLSHFGYGNPRNLCEAVDGALADEPPQWVDRRWPGVIVKIKAQ